MNTPVREIEWLQDGISKPISEMKDEEIQKALTRLNADKDRCLNISGYPGFKQASISKDIHDAVTATSWIRLFNDELARRRSSVPNA